MACAISKSPCRRMVCIWALKGLSYEDLGVDVSTTVVCGPVGNEAAFSVPARVIATRSSTSLPEFQVADNCGMRLKSSDLLQFETFL